MFDTVVLGVDPGVARCGLAVVGIRERRATLVWSTTVRSDPDLPESRRLGKIAAVVRGAISEHSPASVAIERIAWSRNHVSALHVARATGAVMLAAAEAGLGVDEYAPNEVKQAVTGAGNADKRQVQQALVRLHGLRLGAADADAADAAAVALTHLVASRTRAAMARAAAP